MGHRKPMTLVLGARAIEVMRFRSSPAGKLIEGIPRTGPHRAGIKVDSILPLDAGA